MIARILATLAAFECRAFLCALSAAALFTGAGLLFVLLGDAKAGPYCTAFGFTAFAIVLLLNHHEKQNRPR